MSLAEARLDEELALWSGLGRTPRLWWRDDDAWRPSAALDRLLQLKGAVPLSLAIIPSGDLGALARRLRGVGALTVSQHGVDHLNRRAAGEPPGEHPAGATAEQLAGRIARRRRRMVEADLAPAFYTPSWNRIEAELPAAVAVAGFDALSAWGTLGGPAPLRRLDVHLELIGWSPAPRFRGRSRFLGALRRALASRRRAGAFDAPVGLLTHHRSHDAASWAFLEDFIAEALRRFEWLGFGDGLAD